MSYTVNIPQPGDNPSASQDQILKNFQTLDLIYGTSGDHYDWTNTTAVEGFKHAKVTLPGLPTTNPPGNNLPAPTLNNCTIFGLTQVAATTPFSQTTPMVTRDGLAPTAAGLVNIWPLLPIKSYVSFSVLTNTTGAILDSFNIITTGVGAPAVSFGGGVQAVSFTMLDACRSSNYGVLITGNSSISTVGTYIVNSETNFVVRFSSLGGVVFRFTAIIIES